MEEQKEEYEVLDSIYGSGDDRFKAIDETVFQYKFGEDGETTSFLLEIKWPEDYPSVIPEFNLDTFFNQHLSSAQKSAILKLITDESENSKGEVQTYTMIEWVRENYEKIAEAIKATNTATSASQETDERSKGTSGGNESGGVAKVKKEHLTKSQKRKEWDRVDAKGEKPRGYDWIDVIKHLSQTGGQGS